jgi:hypothetical protein
VYAEIAEMLFLSRRYSVAANVSEVFYSGYLYFHAVVAHDASLLMCAQQLPGMARMLANLVL